VRIDSEVVNQPPRKAFQLQLLPFSITVVIGSPARHHLTVVIIIAAFVDFLHEMARMFHAA
jgi:hypothetical protein